MKFFKIKNPDESQDNKDYEYYYTPVTNPIAKKINVTKNQDTATKAIPIAAFLRIPSPFLYAPSSPPAATIWYQPQSNITSAIRAKKPSA